VNNKERGRKALTGKTMSDESGMERPERVSVSRNRNICGVFTARYKVHFVYHSEGPRALKGLQFELDTNFTNDPSWLSAIKSR
jgi:hypothetical protein